VFFRTFCCGTGGRSVILNIEENSSLFAQQAERLVQDLNKRSKQMRDKHISATPAFGRQRGSETTFFTGRHATPTNTRANTSRSLRFFTCLLSLIIAFTLISSHAFALNQIQNSTFDTDTTGWTLEPVTTNDGGTTDFDQDNSVDALWSYFKTKGTQAPTLGYSAYFTVFQEFLAPPEIQTLTQECR